MFPDARISLRRWSVSAETKIPIPVAITLHNFIPSPAVNTERSVSTAKDANNIDGITAKGNDTESPSSSPSKEEDHVRRNRGMWLHRQPQHNNNLLPRLKLEITAILPNHKEAADSESLTVVYSEHSPRVPSVHPSWENLDERISIDKYNDWWNQNELYKSMKVKLSVVSRSDEVKQQEEFKQQGVEDGYFIETYLHPSFLERIDLGSNNNSSSSSEDVDRNSLLPPGLPPNAMLVHFSDGSIRCPPQLYQILWDNYGHSHGILEPPPVEDFSRFEDDAFATLDHVKQTPQRPRVRSITSLLDQDQNQMNHGDQVAGNLDDDGLSRNLPQQDMARLSPTEHHQQESACPHTPERATSRSRQSDDLHNAMTNHQEFKQHDGVSLGWNEQDIVKKEREREKQDLLRLIAEEERALEEDLDCLKVEQSVLMELMEQVQLVERDISKVKDELQRQSLKLEREEILKESQSIKLLRDLRDIYPIALDSGNSSSPVTVMQSTGGSGGKDEGSENAGGNNGYLIRGLRLPADIYTTSISEEEVNTSLGYCAHLVFMVAKYLAVHLRHRIFCNGSRSAIELDGVGIFPLFLGRLAARALEREQVDRGARLLGANVDCIMMHLNLYSSSSPSTLQQRHILAKIQIILDFVAEGKSGA